MYVPWIKTREVKELLKPVGDFFYRVIAIISISMSLYRSTNNEINKNNKKIHNFAMDFHPWRMDYSSMNQKF